MKYKTAVILAAGRCPDDLRDYTGKRLTADLRFGASSVIDLVVAAFRGAGFDRIIVVGTAVSGCTHVHDQGSFVQNLRAGLAEAGKNGTIFVSTCDLPFVTSAEIIEFAQRLRGSALYCSVIPIQACRQVFPQLARTALTVAEGEFTFGNIVAGEDWVWRNALPIVERAFEARKNKLALAWLMGISTAVRYLLAKKRPSVLSIKQLEHRARRMIKTDVQAVVGDWPGIGTDIDTLDHYLAAEAHLGTSGVGV